MAKGTECHIDMREIFNKSKMNANMRPVSNILLGHLSPCRVNRDAQETSKLEILLSFAKLREQIEKEFDNVLVKREEGQPITYMKMSNTKKDFKKAKR
jgi:hypothetical protein